MFFGEQSAVVRSIQQDCPYLLIALLAKAYFPVSGVGSASVALLEAFTNVIAGGKGSSASPMPSVMPPKAPINSLQLNRSSN